MSCLPLTIAKTYKCYTKQSAKHVQYKNDVCMKAAIGLFCKVVFLGKVVRCLKAEKERSQQHELIGMVMRVFTM